MRNPPTLLSLAIDSAVANLSRVSDLSFVPEHILIELFARTLRAGKLNEKILKLFIATGKEEVLSVIESLNIRQILVPVLPTKFVIFTSYYSVFDYKPNIMSEVAIKNDEVDIVIGALQSDLTSFMEAWRPFFSRFHVVIVKDPDLKEDLKIPDGFNLRVYTKSDIDKVVGSLKTGVTFSGYACRYFGYLVSRKKYIISVDDDCFPAKNNKGELVDPISQHIVNLSTPATPFFFNTLYDPYCEGADFVRGYPFSLRSGVECGLSCGLWLNLADFDAPTQALKPELRNTAYVDAVLTVPARAMLPVSGINIAFNTELVGPALTPAFRLAKEGNLRWETVEDIWTGMCVKVICDHLKLGVKSGLPYVRREERGNAIESLKKEWEGVKLMEVVVPFFQSLRLSETSVTSEDCVVEIAKAVKERLGPASPVFAGAAENMVEWLKLWKRVRAQ